MLRGPGYAPISTRATWSRKVEVDLSTLSYGSFIYFWPFPPLQTYVMQIRKFSCFSVWSQIQPNRTSQSSIQGPKSIGSLAYSFAGWQNAGKSDLQIFHPNSIPWVQCQRLNIHHSELWVIWSLNTFELFLLAQVQ